MARQLLESTFQIGYIPSVEWEVLFTAEFETWWNSLSIAQQGSIDRIVGLLGAAGPDLRYPYSSRILTSSYAGMRELRIQHAGDPYRVLYIFDPKAECGLAAWRQQSRR
jgi:hypothetical protein